MKFENLLFAEVLLKKRQMEINWLPRISLSVHISTTYRYVSTYVSKRCRKTRDKFTRKIGLIQIFVHSFFYAGKKESQINTVHVDNRYFLQTHNTCFTAELTFYLFTLLRIQFARGHRFAMTIQFTLQDI